MTEYRHLTAAEALEQLPALQDVYGAVFSEPPYNEGPEKVGKFAGWVRDESTKPGFDMVVAEDDGRVIGFAYGYTMPAGEWWHHAAEPWPEERDLVDQATSADKFAVMEWAVHPDARGRWVGRQLMDGLITGRREPWATLTVNQEAPAHQVYGRWGWRSVAETQPGKGPAMDVLVLTLHG